jgi:hypothetical protein
MKTGIATLPLHYGKAPRWLFARMKLLARQIILVMAEEFGPGEILKRLSDPYWFQALGCVLGFDWHSSGLTTTVGGALKEGLKGLEGELGLFIAGGKGASSLKTPQEIERAGALLACDPARLIYSSRMAAKVDSAALQDGYQLYHHLFIFTRQGEWAVVQQGMNEQNRMARRYHWLSQPGLDFVNEPHQAVCCNRSGQALNLVARESESTRATSTELARQPADKLMAELKKLQNLTLPTPHQVLIRDIHPDRLYKIFLKTYERKPPDFERLLGLEGVGPKTIRALSLISELIYGTKPSFRDPVRYSFAHGGKDGHPYPVNKSGYDRSIEILHRAISAAKLGRREKLEAIRRLQAWWGGQDRKCKGVSQST